MVDNKIKFMKNINIIVKTFIKLILIIVFINSNSLAFDKKIDESNQDLNHQNYHHKTANQTNKASNQHVNNDNSTNQDLILKKHKINANNVKNFNQNIENYHHSLSIVNNQNKTLLKLEVAVADNDQLRTYGLMNLKKLPLNKGMIFIFDQLQILNFWMKDTLIPLDILFVDNDNKIIKIHQNNQPHSQAIISSQMPVNKAIEVNAGIVKKYNIQVNHRIIFDKL